MYAYTQVDFESKDKHKIYYFKGDLMYPSAKNFKSRFRYENDPDLVIVDAQQLKIEDFTGVVALKNIYDMYKSMNKKLRIRNMDEHSSKLCKKT